VIARRRATVLLATATCLSAVAPAVAADPEPRTPIRHFVTLMQENHSFDNYFGTYPGADGIPEGTCMPVDPEAPKSECVKPLRVGRRPVELPHSVEIFRAQMRGGRMDGFISGIARQTGVVQKLVMGRYDDRDIPYYWNVADEFVLFDRFFTSSNGASLSNHMFWATGTPGNRKGEFIPPEGFDKPDMIFDRLQEKGISWKFYVQNYDSLLTFRSDDLGDRASQVVWVPPLSYPRYIDDPRLSRHIVPIEEFYEDARRGTLPAVSYIAPSGSSEHPPGSIKSGETFVRTLVNALMRSRLWNSSALMWSYDDWGGWYDHVRPPRVDRWGYGFRAPALLVSPWARRGHIEHGTMDFTSILKFIEENWDLRPLAERDRRARSIMPAFDFEQRPRKAVFLTRDRHVRQPPEPRRAAVYVGYGAALIFGLLVMGAAALRERRSQRSAGPFGGRRRAPV